MIFDKWAILRQQTCYGNIEPMVELVNDPNEFIVAESAAISYGTDLVDEYHKRRLISNLIRKGHHVPLEFCVFQFRLTGISKSCSSQIARHRMSSQVSSSRRYREQGISFVYPLLSNIDNEVDVEQIYEIMSAQNRNAVLAYEYLRNHNVTKQDARRVIPVCSAVEKYISINARSLTNFLRLRLALDAEWEVRRIAGMVLSIVKEVTPTLFEDITNGI